LQLPKWLVWKLNNIDATNEFCQPTSIMTIFEIEVSGKIVDMYDIVLGIWWLKVDMFVLVLNPRQMCFNDDAIVKCMSEKISPFGITTFARLSSTPLPHKFETFRISGSPIACKRGSAIFIMFGFEICTPLDYTLHYECENDNPTTNLNCCPLWLQEKWLPNK